MRCLGKRLSRIPRLDVVFEYRAVFVVEQRDGRAIALVRSRIGYIANVNDALAAVREPILKFFVINVS